jgi:hypothetical protein
VLRGSQLRLKLVAAGLQGRTARVLSVSFAAVVIATLALLFWLARRQPAHDASFPVPPEIAAMDLKSLRKQAALVDGRLQKLREKMERLFPTGPAIMVDSAANQISLIQGTKVLAQDRCSTGTGFELTETSGKRTWTFDTPRGYFRVLSKVSNPIWYRPDWAFVEEGEPIPKDRSARAVANVLGDYAIAFGDGYFIHGTLYTRMLGTSVTHGCIRVDDDTLKKIYQTAQAGTPIWIY